MARKLAVQILRTTRANLETQKTASGLLAGEPYLITDENRLAIGTDVDTYMTIPNETDLGDIETLLAAL
jgi:hypothetical protein